MFGWIAALFAAVSSLGAVQLAMPFSDHMVLQAGVPVPVWGTAAPGEKVTVEFCRSDAHRRRSNADDAWRVTLAPFDYAPGHAAQTLLVRGGAQEKRIVDVLIGEVWLCSGQSNMRFTLGRKAEPRDDQAPLERLARLARAAVYGEKIAASGPVLVSADVRDEAIVLTFAHTEGGLFVRGEKLEDFEVAGGDGKFVPATAMITGHNQLTIATRGVAGGNAKAKFVRYAWREFPLTPANTATNK